jgi:N6-L-threonylcarbamoyladenine synthase
VIVLGIETSCDETAASLVSEGTKILSSVVSSQVAVHHPYGGIVPELASRKHIEAIDYVVNDAINQSGISLNRIDAVAVTQGPGLVGSLLVGFCFAKGFACALDLPWVGINHLEGHINSVSLTDSPPSFPFVALLVSGGHTSIYHVKSHTEFVLMGQTRDDAAGEAFDKVSKMLGLGYPGGVIIDRLAKQGNCQSIRFPRSYLDKFAFDFSFSGIKTSVNRYIQTHGDLYKAQVPDIVASFQEAIVDVLTYKIINAAKKKECRHIALVGGVAANSRLRARLMQDASAEGFHVHIPSIDLCGDNAAMIAATGYHYLMKGITSDVNQDVYSRSINL